MKASATPLPRRKACNACIKAKRRCNLGFPQCSRCTAKHFECNYDGQVPRRRQQPPKVQDQAMITGHSRVPPLAMTNDPRFEPVVVLDLPDLNFDPMTMSHEPFGFTDFVPSLPIPPFPEDYPTVETLVASEVSIGIYKHEDYDHLDDICDDYEPDQLNDDTARVACAVAAIRCWHRSMAFSLSTPFMHRKLYAAERPALITAAFTSCLMYATKTPRTEDIILPLIENNAAALIIEHSGVEPSPSIALARAQALLLYQTMRKADYVDRDLCVLESWVAHLTNLRDQTRANGSSVSRYGQTWDEWIFWECVSRTIIAAAFFINVHCLIARGEHPLGPWTKPHLWTASKRLWDAKSSQQFYEIWQRKKPLMVCNIFLNDLIREGDGNEMDAFASMLMVPCIGLDATKKFSKGRVEELDSSNIDPVESRGRHQPFQSQD